MKHLKMLLVLILAICSTTSVNAQVKKAHTVKAAQKMVYSCPMKCEGSKTYNKPGKCPKCNMKLKAKKADATAAMYQCPMKCEGEKTYATAGKCPVCNMNLKTVNKEIVAANYQCPMKCEGNKMYAAAGKCPECNMNLKEVTATVTDEHKGHNHN
jgi:uncharacterized protein with PIN domain